MLIRTSEFVLALRMTRELVPYAKQSKSFDGKAVLVKKKRDEIGKKEFKRKLNVIVGEGEL